MPTLQHDPSRRSWLDQGAAGPQEHAALALLLLAALIVISLDANLWHPGFSSYDEESQLDVLQAWRQGMALPLRFAGGGLHRRLLAALTWLGGPSLTLLRLPSLAGLAAELGLLYTWLRPRLGERAALWACAADLVCSATLLRGRCIISPAILPAVFLAHAVALDRLRRPWQHCLFGFSLLLWTLDYEGWIVGLAWLAPAWAWAHGRGPGAARRWAAFLAGEGGGGALVLGLSYRILAAHFGTRASVSLQEPGRWTMAAQNLRDLLGPGHRMAYAAVAGQPWPSPWIWPLLLLGAVGLLRLAPEVAALTAVGLVPLLLANTSAEPQRLSLALLGLAAMAGVGAARLWRRRWGPLALALLLALGVASEARAWLRRDPVQLGYAYGRSQGLLDAARWLRQNQPPEGWQVLDGLGSYDDGSFRFLLDAAGVDRQGRVPVALVHADQWPALKGLGGPVLPFGDPLWPLALYLPAPAEVGRLRAIQAELADYHRACLTGWPQPLRAQALARLKDRGLSDPWARTSYWESWMFYNVIIGDVDAGALAAMLREPLVSGWPYDAAAQNLHASAPAYALALRRRAEIADPRRAQRAYRSARY